MKPIKVLVLKIFILVVSLEAVVVTTNITVDPGHLIDRIAKDISNLMLSGKNIAQYPNDLDFRDIHINCIRDDRFHPKIICVGSSRGWQVSKDLFKGTTFYNACVGSANLTDYIAIYQILKKNKKLPDTLIIAIDPWTIDDSRGASHNLNSFAIFNYDFRVLATEMGYFKKYRLFTPGILVAKYVNPNAYELASFSYFQESLKSIFSIKKRPYRVMESVNDTCKILLSDGSIIYPQWFSDLKTDSVIAMAKSFAEKEIRNEFGVSSFNIQLITSLLQKIKRDGVVPVLFLTPYNPFSFDMINQYNRSLEKDEQAIKNISIKENIECIGTYNPHLCNFDNSYFYDYYHLKKKGIDELYRSREKF
jgi:hypothetical protein